MSKEFFIHLITSGSSSIRSLSFFSFLPWFFYLLFCLVNYEYLVILKLFCFSRRNLRSTPTLTTRLLTSRITWLNTVRLMVSLVSLRYYKKNSFFTKLEKPKLWTINLKHFEGYESFIDSMNQGIGISKTLNKVGSVWLISNWAATIFVFVPHFIRVLSDGILT